MFFQNGRVLLSGAGKTAKTKLKKLRILVLQVRYQIGVPYNHELREKTWETTDLAECDFVVLKNFI